MLVEFKQVDGWGPDTAIIEIEDVPGHAVKVEVDANGVRLVPVVRRNGEWVEPDNGADVLIDYFYCTPEWLDFQGSAASPQDNHVHLFIHTDEEPVLAIMLDDELRIPRDSIQVDRNYLSEHSL